MRQRVCILGATGSVGQNTLDVIAQHPERFEVVALSAHARMDDLVRLCEQWRPRYAAVGDALQAIDVARRLHAAGLKTDVVHSPQALCELAAHPDVDSVMAAIVGAAGLAPCLAAAAAGKRLMLANKEALVVGAGLFMRTVRDGGAALLPIDSEHSAIFQCLPADRQAWAGMVDHIVLTASGGPFRNRDPRTLDKVTPQEACAHPNWVMGRKISVDSATMMNKALEVIEARWLFGLGHEQIRVLIHPQSIIHSMVVCRDASVLAQLGTPDMKVPISVGLAHPQRMASGAPALDFRSVGALTFEPVDRDRFPGLDLAYQALREPDGSTAVLNAANEVAVQAFLDRRMRYTDIHRVNSLTLERVRPEIGDADSLEGLLELDGRARRAADALVGEFAT